ncbi:MAG: hypothetical protein EON57_01315 [Alphaproteobacteria bacterium]|nr:MAG: hypothetical protein EON57_01315 [Alphaproteobacteria bacterium]
MATSSVSSTASLISASTSTSSTSSSSSSSSTTSTSDIDWDGLIEEAVAAKLTKADSIDLKITNNEAKDDALLSDLDSIQSLLSFQMQSSSADLLLLSRGTELPADFTLDIVTDSSGTITSVSIGGDASMFTVNGTRIIGKTGTDYEGFTFVYAGSGSKSVDVGFSTGIAELLYNVTDAATNEDDGTLTTLIDGLSDTNDTLQDKSDDIRERAETYRTNLTNRYAAYQSAISEAESLQDYLTTLLETWNSSS